MLFLKDDNTDKFIGHVALDWQCVRYHSPALDVGNFVYTSMKPEARRKHLPELLTTYFDILRQTAADLGHPIDMSFDVISLLKVVIYI